VSGCFTILEVHFGHLTIGPSPSFDVAIFIHYNSCRDLPYFPLSAIR